MIVHEIAHQWFGNAVTESDWDDVWLSEGFATYFTHLFVEHADGRDDASWPACGPTGTRSASSTRRTPTTASSTTTSPT